MRKVKDTSFPISEGGRVERYWRNRSVKPRNSKLVVGAGSPDSIDLKQLTDTYKLKGFEFGNWCSIGDRNDTILAAEVALKDLSKLLGTTNVGINGQIGIAFGARGISRAMAHYEPALNMINLTKTKGAGCLAHEYGHALDYNFGSFIDQNRKYPSLTGGHLIGSKCPDNLGGQYRCLANAIVDLYKMTDSYHALSQKVGMSEYWYRRTEVFARFFEQYVSYKYKQARKPVNAYLTQSFESYLGMYGYYLDENDMKQLVPLGDEFCKIVGQYLNGKLQVVPSPYHTDF